MKHTFSFLIILLSAGQLFSQKQKVIATADGKCAESAWKIAFEDNFDGNEINQKVWKNRESSQGSLDGDGIEEYFSFNNIKVENGICNLIPKTETLTIKAVNWKADTAILGDGKPNLRTYYHTSVWMETKEKFLYGKYEIRCKVPKGKGLWPGFWMYGENNGINNEIDVFEFWNPKNSFGNYSPKKLSAIHHMTVHYNHKMTTDSYSDVDFSLDYHTFTVIWDSTKIEWYMDGKLKRVTTQYLTKRGNNVDCKDVKANHTYILNPVFPKDTECILVSMGIQSGKNAPDENTFKGPAFQIDYIRYYKPVEK